MQKADHSGHRDRMREKYLTGGIEALAPHEIIEMLLYNAVPYRNTNDLAKNLTDRFGSLTGVFDAPLEMLIDEGMTRNQAVFLKFIPDVIRTYMTEKHEKADMIIDMDTVGKYLADMFIGREDIERVVLLLVDRKLKMVFCGVISIGTFNASNIYVRQVVKLALNHRAVGAIFAHNHPSGLALPSKEDYRTTLELRDILKAVNVELLDHFIIADNEAVSMAQSGLLDEDN